MEDEKLPDPGAEVQTVVTVDFVVNKLQAKADRMGKGNENRLLLLNAIYTIKQLVRRLAVYEDDSVVRTKKSVH